jgi:hypothetical protein
MEPDAVWRSLAPPIDLAGVLRRSACATHKDLHVETRLFRSREVLVVLVLVAALIGAKQLPVANGLPLGELAGIVCFAFAIYLSLRIYAAERARIRAE